MNADLKSQTAAAQLHSTGIYTGEVLQPPRLGGFLSSILESPGRFQDVCRRRANNRSEKVMAVITREELEEFIEEMIGGLNT